MFYSLQKFRKGVRTTYVLYGDPQTEVSKSLDDFFMSKRRRGVAPIVKICRPGMADIYGEIKSTIIESDEIPQRNFQVVFTETAEEEGKIAALDYRLFEVKIESGRAKKSNKGGSK